MKTNDYGDVIFSEEDVLGLIYQNPDFNISKLFFEDPTKYNSVIKELALDLPELKTIPTRESLEKFDRQNIDDWNMPEKYYQINVLEWLLKKCQSDAERLRVQLEYDLFEKKNFIRVLQFLIYFVDTLRANNVVWGVGRGSSVSSFCLFLIGVHKINPLLYDLDYREFLR